MACSFESGASPRLIHAFDVQGDKVANKRVFVTCGSGIPDGFRCDVASLVPTVGGPLSLIVLAGLLYWRSGAASWVDIAASVAVARLAMVPALIPFA